MKITKYKLKQIIKEELSRVLREDEISFAKRPEHKLGPIGYPYAEADWSADWPETRQKYHDAESQPAWWPHGEQRPQGLAKWLTHLGRAQGKVSGATESALRTLGSIPNAIRDANEIYTRAYTGGHQSSREGDARDIANRRLVSGEWTQVQADQFVDTIVTGLAGTIEGSTYDAIPPSMIADFEDRGIQAPANPHDYPRPALPGEEARKNK